MLVTKATPDPSSMVAISKRDLNVGLVRDLITKTRAPLDQLLEFPTGGPNPNSSLVLEPIGKGLVVLLTNEDDGEEGLHLRALREDHLPTDEAWSLLSEWRSA